MSWYALLRVAHSYWQWVVLVTAAITLARAMAGAFGARDWTNADQRAARVFISAVDVQLLIGIVLYFGFSPFWTATYESFSETMREQGARFFGVEHQAAMLMATAVAHIGWVRAKRAAPGLARHRIMRTTLLVFLAFVLWAIPWPWRPYGRPFFRTTW